MLFLGLLVALEKQLDRRSVRKFRRLAESAVANVEKFGERLDLSMDHAAFVLGSGAVECLRLRHRVRQRIGGALQIGPLIAIRIGDGQQDAPETGPPALIVRGEIRAPIKWLAIRKEKAGERPSALPGKGADGGLVARVDIGALVAVDFHGHKMLVDNFTDFRVLVPFPFDYFAPVPPPRPN